MEKIELYTPEKFLEGSIAPYVIIGEPSERLYSLQEEGHCVLAELRTLQGLSETEVAERLCQEEAVIRYRNVCIDADALPQTYFQRIWCRHIGVPVTIAETHRLLIRESTEEDAEAFYELYREEACRKYLEQPLNSLTGKREADLAAYVDYLRQYKNGQYGFYEYGMWSVIEKESGCCIGRAGVELQEVLCLGYALRREWRGKGYAEEACRAILEYCGVCGYAEKLYVRIAAENTASVRVWEKLTRKKVISCTKSLFLSLPCKK